MRESDSFGEWKALFGDIEDLNVKIHTSGSIEFETDSDNGIFAQLNSSNKNIEFLDLEFYDTLKIQLKIKKSNKASFLIWYDSPFSEDTMQAIYEIGINPAWIDEWKEFQIPFYDFKKNIETHNFMNRIGIILNGECELGPIIVAKYKEKVNFISDPILSNTQNVYINDQINYTIPYENSTPMLLEDDFRTPNSYNIRHDVTGDLYFRNSLIKLNTSNETYKEIESNLSYFDDARWGNPYWIYDFHIDEEGYEIEPDTMLEIDLAPFYPFRGYTRRFLSTHITFDNYDLNSTIFTHSENYTSFPFYYQEKSNFSSYEGKFGVNYTEDYNISGLFTYSPLNKTSNVTITSNFNNSILNSYNQSYGIALKINENSGPYYFVDGYFVLLSPLSTYIKIISIDNGTVGGWREIYQYDMGFYPSQYSQMTVDFKIDSTNKAIFDILVDTDYVIATVHAEDPHPDYHSSFYGSHGTTIINATQNSYIIEDMAFKWINETINIDLFYGEENVHRRKPVGTSPRHIRIGDANNDGYNDIVTSNAGTNTISIYLWNPIIANWSSIITQTTGNGPRCVAIGDIDYDGDNDMVSADFGSDQLTIFKWTGSTWSSASQTSGNDPWAVDIGDADNDGKNEIVVSNEADNDISVFSWNTATMNYDRSDVAVGNSPKGIRIGDLDNDGDSDIAVSNAGDNDVSMLLWTGSWWTKTDVAVSGGPRHLDIGDLDDDGDNDVAVACNVGAVGSRMTILYFQSGTTWTRTDLTSYPPHQIEIGDINCDGYNDVISAGTGATINSLYYWHPSSGWTQSWIYAGSNSWGVDFEYLNDNATKHIVFANQPDNDISIYLRILFNKYRYKLRLYGLNNQTPSFNSFYVRAIYTEYEASCFFNYSFDSSNISSILEQGLYEIIYNFYLNITGNFSYNDNYDLDFYLFNPKKGSNTSLVKNYVFYHTIENIAFESLNDSIKEIIMEIQNGEYESGFLDNYLINNTLLFLLNITCKGTMGNFSFVNNTFNFNIGEISKFATFYQDDKYDENIIWEIKRDPYLNLESQFQDIQEQIYRIWSNKTSDEFTSFILQFQTENDLGRSETWFNDTHTIEFYLGNSLNEVTINLINITETYGEYFLLNITKCRLIFMAEDVSRAFNTTYAEVYEFFSVIDSDYRLEHNDYRGQQGKVLFRAPYNQTILITDFYGIDLYRFPHVFSHFIDILVPIHEITLVNNYPYPLDITFTRFSLEGIIYNVPPQSSIIIHLYHGDYDVIARDPSHDLEIVDDFSIKLKNKKSQEITFGEPIEIEIEEEIIEKTWWDQFLENIKTPEGIFYTVSLFVIGVMISGVLNLSQNMMKKYRMTLFEHKRREKGFQKRGRKKFPRKRKKS